MSRQRIWDFWAQHYESLWVQEVSLAPTRRELLIHLEKILYKNKKYKILDVGCGIGQLLRDIERKFIDYDLELSGIDFSQGMIDRAIEIGGEISFQRMDVNNLENLKKEYDIIICTHSFPYYKDQQNILREFRMVLREGGYLLLAQASQNNFYDGITMFFVKFTTGKAKYPSVKSINKMIKNLFKCEAVIRIRERFYMPSIYFFLLKGE